MTSSTFGLIDREVFYVHSHSVRNYVTLEINSSVLFNIIVYGVKPKGGGLQLHKEKNKDVINNDFNPNPVNSTLLTIIQKDFNWLNGS